MSLAFSTAPHCQGEFGSQEKLSELRLYTNATMTANIALYTRRGYRETHSEAYKGSDIVHMAKRL